MDPDTLTTIAAARGTLIGHAIALCAYITLRLWTYSPPVPAAEWNRRVYRNRLISVPFITAVIFGCHLLFFEL